MQYNVYDYFNVIIGQVEANDAVEAWSEASKRFNNVLDVREVEVSLKSKYHIARTIYITPEAQSAMLDLIKRAKGKKVEYQLELLLEGDKVYPGATKWGAPERLHVFRSGIGAFHTHPGKLEVKLSDIDILHILISPHKIIGVGAPETYLVRTIPNGIDETADVQFATLVEEVSPEARKGFLEIMPMVVMLNVPVEGVEHYYNIYEFTLGRRPIPIEILE